MVKLDAIKDGLGNVIIAEHSFEHLLNCLDNQKFIQSYPPHQIYIDDFNNQCRKILHQRYIFEAIEDGYFLTKRYQFQDKITSWSGDDVVRVYELFKDTIMKFEKPKNLTPITDELIKDGNIPLGVTSDGWIICEPDPRPWLIERSLRSDYEYLTISEDGKTNRPWKEDEVESIKNIFNGLEIKEDNYYNEQLWKDQLSKMNSSVIEQYLRKLKIEKL